MSFSMSITWEEISMIEIFVCVGSACHLSGSNNVVMTFQHMIEQYKLHDKVSLTGSFCMNNCDSKGVSVKIGKERYRIDAANARTFFKETVLPLVQE